MVPVGANCPSYPAPQVCAAGAQPGVDTPEDEDEEAVPNEQNCLRGCSWPHLGHFNSLSLSLMLRRRSNFSPHLGH